MIFSRIMPARIMPIRIMSTVSGVLLSLAILCGVCTAADRPNIVFFLIDDLGRADVGFMGGQTYATPQIDKLARGGAILDAHYVQPVCSPTRAALMTGRYATHTGVYTIVRPHAQWSLPLNERTLANALHDAGYETAITGKWHLGEFQPACLPTARGFDHQYGHYFGALDYFTHVRDGSHDWYRDDRELKEEGYSTQLLSREACRLIAEKDKAKPLFLYVPFNGVHSPMQAPESYTQPYAALTANRQKLGGMLAAVDEAIGEIVAALDKAGIRDNTLIVFSSDNGGPESRQSVRQRQSASRQRDDLRRWRSRVCVCQLARSHSGGCDHHGTHARRGLVSHAREAGRRVARTTSAAGRSRCLAHADSERQVAPRRHPVRAVAHSRRRAHG
jgi:arylsulfatase A-like enzyme